MSSPSRPPQIVVEQTPRPSRARQDQGPAFSVFERIERCRNPTAHRQGDPRQLDKPSSGRRPPLGRRGSSRRRGSPSGRSTIAAILLTSGLQGGARRGSFRPSGDSCAANSAPIAPSGVAHIPEARYAKALVGGPRGRRTPRRGHRPGPGARSDVLEHPPSFNLEPACGLTTSPHANSIGNSEPAIAIGGPHHTLVVDGLAWLPFQVNLWKGSFGDTPPAMFGAMDTTVPVAGKGRVGLGDGDGDVEVTSVGTILLVDLDFIVNQQFKFQLGVSVTRCPSTATGPGDCTTTTLDRSGADRPWFTVNGTSAWLSYHDSGSSSIIHVLRSSDDGVTWQKAGNPIVGQGRVTGNSTFNNIQGPLVADPHSGNVYDVFASGQPGVQKATSSNFNNIYVSRSTNGTLWAAWSYQHTVWLSSSTDAGSHWTAPTGVSTTNTGLSGVRRAAARPPARPGHRHPPVPAQPPRRPRAGVGPVRPPADPARTPRDHEQQEERCRPEPSAVDAITVSLTTTRSPWALIRPIK